MNDLRLEMTFRHSSFFPYASLIIIMTNERIFSSVMIILN